MSDFDAEIERLRQTCAIAEANRQIAEDENQQLRKLRDELRALNEDKHRHLEAYRKAASADKADIKRLRQERDEARRVARDVYGPVPHAGPLAKYVEVIFSWENTGE